MGICVTAYKNLTLLYKPIFDADGRPVDFNHWIAGINIRNQHTAPEWWYPIIPNLVYEWTEAYIFNAGDLFQHARWLEQLKYFKGENGFQEFTSYAGCNRVIGSNIAAIISNDFSKYNKDAIDYAKSLNHPEGILFIDAYQYWKKAFELAADNGAVEYYQPQTVI